MRVPICHLSDIHFVEGKNAILEKKEQLCSAILEYIHKNEDVLFLISGDIAQSCDENQYIVAKSFFKDIQETLFKRKNIKSHFIFAPGNHDAVLDPKDLDEVNRRRDILTRKDAMNMDDLMFYQDKMCVKQKNYYDFVSGFAEETVISTINTDSPLLKQYKLNIAEYDININVLNTSWISQRNEKPGEIYMPRIVYEKKIVKQEGLNITMYHHPSNWMHPDDKLFFDSEICNQSDIIFVGHEHIGREEHISTSRTEFNIEYGEVLQDLENENNSGFKMHFVEDGTISTYAYSWDYEQKYYTTNNKIDRKLGDNIYKALCFLPQYREKLNSLDMQVTHPRKKKVILSDLFIFPNAETYNGDRSFEESTKEKVTIHGENLMGFILENHFVEFSGGVKVGKSALAKMIAIKLEQRNIHAIIIDCRKITNFSIKNVEKVEEEAIYEAYSKQKAQIYRQLPTERKVVIFDNIDVIKSDRFIRDVITHFSNYYDYVVSFTSMSYELAMLNETIQQENEISIKHCVIKELGHKQRNRLYKKWYELNEGDSIIVEEELEKRVKEATDTINTLKGNGYMPCIAPNILIILQQLEFQPERNQDRSNYGHMYEFLIDKSILDMKKNCDTVSIDIASGILIWVAEYMLKNKCKVIEEHVFYEIVDAYNRCRITDASKDSYLKEYVRVDLVEFLDGQIRFKYPYIHYYYTAKYLSNNISQEEVRNAIRYMAANLQNEECGDIMIFLCHISKEKFIFSSVLEASKKLLEESKIFDFKEYKDIKMDFEKHLDTSFLPEKDKEKRQDQLLEQQDRYEEEHKQEEHTYTVTEIEGKDEDDDELQQQIKVLDAAFKSIEVMGQILKNYPGTIDGDIKVDLLMEAHALGMRSLTFSYEMIKGAIKRSLNKVCKKIREELSKMDVVIDDKFIIKCIDKQSSAFKIQTDNLFGYMCYTLIRRLSNSLGNEDLKPLINHVKMDDVISYRLMKWSVYLNEFGVLVGIPLITYYESLKKSKDIFASKILKLFVYEHYYVYGTKDITMRKRIWDKLEFVKKQEEMLLLTQSESSKE